MNSVPLWLETTASIVLAMTIVIGGLLAFLRTRPMRWFGQQIMDEFAEKLGVIINHGIQEYHDSQVAPQFLAISLQLKEIEKRVEINDADARVRSAEDHLGSAE